MSDPVAPTGACKPASADYSGSNLQGSEWGRHECLSLSSDEQLSIRTGPDSGCWLRTRSTRVMALQSAVALLVIWNSTYRVHAAKRIGLSRLCEWIGQPQPIRYEQVFIPARR